MSKTKYSREERVITGNILKTRDIPISVPAKIIKNPIAENWIDIRDYNLIRVKVKGEGYLRFDTGPLVKTEEVSAEIPGVAKGADTPAVKAQVDITNSKVAAPVILRLIAKDAGVAGNQITVKVELVAGGGNPRKVTITKGSTVEIHNVLGFRTSSTLRTSFSRSTLVDAATIARGITTAANAFSRSGPKVGDYTLSGGVDLIPGKPAILAVPAVTKKVSDDGLKPDNSLTASDTSPHTVYISSGAAADTITHTIMCRYNYVRIVKVGNASVIDRIELI